MHLGDQKRKENEAGGKESRKDSCRGFCGLSTLLIYTVSTCLSALAPFLLSGDPGPRKNEPGLKNSLVPAKHEACIQPLRHSREWWPPSTPSQLPAWQQEKNAQLGPNHPSSFSPLTHFSIFPSAFPGGCLPEPHAPKTSDTVFLVKMLGVLFWVTYTLPRSQERKRRRERRKGKMNVRGINDLLIGFIFPWSSRPFPGFCKLFMLTAHWCHLLVQMLYVSSLS